MTPRSLILALLAALSFLWSIDASAERMSKKERKLLRQKKMQKDAELRKARSYRKFRMPGEQVAANVKKLTSELVWHENLDAALAQAKKLDRPVLWIHALGELEGYS